MTEVHWSEVAETDLDDIYDYIARDVPYYAEMFVGTLIEVTDKLETYPRMGRKVPEADYRDDVRELIVQGYRIIYLLQTNQLQILTVIHGSRDLSGQEKSRGKTDREAGYCTPYGMHCCRAMRSPFVRKTPELTLTIVVDSARAQTTCPPYRPTQPPITQPVPRRLG